MKNLKRLAVFLILLSIVLVPQLASAQNPITVDSLGLSYAEYTGLGTKDVRATIAMIINVALGLLGIVAVVLIIYGGLVWMTAGGDDGKIKTARGIIVSGVIGLAIILTAYAIAAFVLSALVNATS